MPSTFSLHFTYFQILLSNWLATTQCVWIIFLHWVLAPFVAAKLLGMKIFLNWSKMYLTNTLYILKTPFPALSLDDLCFSSSNNRDVKYCQFLTESATWSSSQTASYAAKLISYSYVCKVIENGLRAHNWVHFAYRPYSLLLPWTQALKTWNRLQLESNN